MQKLSNQKVWITRGGTGIGAGAAVALARSGVEAFVSGRRREPLDAVVRAIAEIGGAEAFEEDGVSSAIGD